MDNKIKDIPKTQANITLQPYIGAMTLNENEIVHLSPLQKEIIEKLHFDRQTGHIQLEGNNKTLNDVEVQNLLTKEYINELDMSVLRTFYTIVLNEYEKHNYQNINNNIEIYVPDLLKSLGMKPNQSKEQVAIFINSINQFKNLIGVITAKAQKRTYTSYYALINFNYYDDIKNTFSFNAPFLEYIVKEVYKQSIVKDNDGKVIHDKYGKVKRKPCYSYLIKSEIAKERNKAAIENVNIIVTTIEQAGGCNAHISAKTIVERNPLLMQQLEQALPKHRNQLLARIFKKTFELLHTETRLEEVYPNIVIPDANDKNNMPKWKDLESYVYEFPHDKKTTKKAK